MRYLATCLIVGLVFLLSDNVFSQEQKEISTSYVSGMTAGRARALVGVAVGIISLVIGWRAKVRSARGSNVRAAAIIAIVIGMVGIVLSLLHLNMAAGAVFGSGSGKAGAIFGLVPNLAGATLGALALKQKNIQNGTY